MTAARRTLPEVFDPNEGCVFLGSVTTRSIDAWGIIKSFFLFVLLALEAWGLWYLAKHRDRKALLLMLLVITCLLFVTLRGLLQTWHGVHVYSRSASGKLSGGERGPVNASSKGSFVPSGHSDTPYDVVWGDVSSWDLGWPFTYAGLVKRTNGFCTVQANGIATEYSPNTMTPATLSDVMRETDAAIVAKQRGTISPPMGALAKTIDPIVFMPGSGWTFLGTAYTWRFYSTYLTLDAAFWLAAGFIIWGFLRGFTQHKGRGFEVILIDKKAVGSDCPVTAWEAEPKE